MNAAAKKARARRRASAYASERVLDALCKGALPRGHMSHGRDISFDQPWLSWRDKLFYMNRQERRSKGVKTFQEDINKLIAEQANSMGLAPGDDLTALTEIVAKEFVHYGMLTPRPVKLSWVNDRIFLGLQEP